MSPRKFAKMTTLRNLVGLGFLYLLVGLGVGLGANALMGGCATTRRVGPKIVKIGAEECVEIAKEKGDSKTETVCATIDDLVPFLDQILAVQQARAAGDEAAAAAAMPPGCASSIPTPAPEPADSK